MMKVYNREGWTVLEGETFNQMGKEENREQEIWIILGAFNARIGHVEKIITGDGQEIKRKPIDEICNTEGSKMLRWVEEAGLMVLNGDKEGQWAYHGGGSSTVADYGVVNERAREITESNMVEERIESDHMPLTVKLRI